jgi:alpha-aminoadipate carrier protein LysW
MIDDSEIDIAEIQILSGGGDTKMKVQTKTVPAPIAPPVDAAESTGGAVYATAFCPDCGWTINLAPQSKRGQRVICRRCGADLELVSLEPPELDWVTSEFEGRWWSFDHHGC